MLVHLRHYHNKSKKFKHPLLEDCKPTRVADAAILAENLFADRSDGNKEAFVRGMLSSLRFLVGRFLAASPETRRYTDDMVSEGLLSLSKIARNLTREELDGRPVMKVVSSRMQTAIETMLYDVGNVSAPSKATHDRNFSAGKPTPYGVVETDLSKINPLDNSSKEEQDLIDAQEALDTMAARLQLDADLLKPEFRSLTSEEVADMLDVPSKTIRRRRARLRNIYHIEFGG